jgi:thioesterase domain-containing protein
MLDTPFFNDITIEFKDNADILAYLLNSGDNYNISANDFRQLDSYNQFEFFLEHAKFAKQIFPKNMSINQFPHLFNIYKNNLNAMLKYRPKYYEGNILFFKAKEQKFDYLIDSNMYWKKLVNNIYTYSINGNHFSMNKSPNVEIMAKIINKYLI